MGQLRNRSKWQIACFTGVQHFEEVFIAKATAEGMRTTEIFGHHVQL